MVPTPTRSDPLLTFVYPVEHGARPEPALRDPREPPQPDPASIQFSEGRDNSGPSFHS